MSPVQRHAELMALKNLGDMSTEDALSFIGELVDLSLDIRSGDGLNKAVAFATELQYDLRSQTWADRTRQRRHFAQPPHKRVLPQDTAIARIMATDGRSLAPVRPTTVAPTVSELPRL